jgi:Big-like domain-containing protein/calcineurin-like phosphoesterase family protein
MFAKLCRTALVAGVALGCNDVASSPDQSSAPGVEFALSVKSVSVQPSSATVDVGHTVQLTATAKPRKVTSFTWSSSNTSVATVSPTGLSPTGLVTGVAAGTATITAASGSARGTATITVRATTVPVASVTVTPNPASVGVGATVQLTATLKDANGNVLTGRTVAWTTNAAAVATVSSSGLVSGVAAGTATITATSEGKSGTSALTVTSAPPPGGSVLLAAGDISSCSSSGDEATATLLDGLTGTVATLGDNVYPDGTAAEFSNCYNPTWGRHKARTRPSPGNHDYHTSGATGYYGYFGASAGPSGRGYYSYDLGAWHIVSLNSNVSMSAGSAQEQWLRADLAANPKECTLAYWHHPRFSSGTNHGNFSAAQPIWQALYDFNADVVLSGHEHNYERFAPQTPTGAADATRGVREFVVGTGGASHYTGHSSIPNSQVFNGSTWGVLKVTLSAGSYGWQFIPVAGQSFTDSGTGSCH